MTFNHLISLCNPLAVEGPEPGRIGGIAHDSRTVDYDYVFVAVKGNDTDGHQYVEEAIENGARTIIHEEPIPNKQSGICYIHVEATRPLLGYLAQAYYNHPADWLKIIGITGTDGKTTVATLTYQMLRKLGERPSLSGTNGTIIEGRKVKSKLTTEDPIELAEKMHEMVQAGSTHLVMEVSSHALEQQRTRGVPFDVAGFTNISHDHLDYHGSMDQYVAAKKRLFDGLAEESTAVVNADDTYAEQMIANTKAEVVRFGFSKNSGVTAEIDEISLSGLRLHIEDVEITSPLCGRFNAYNLVQSFLIGRALGHPDSKVATALSQCKGAGGRLERLNEPGESRPTVYVDYAHTPYALENVLSTLSELKEKEQSLYLLFGCGGDRDPDKRPKMAGIAERYADHIIVSSDNPRNESPETIIDDIMKGFSSTDKVRREVDRRKAIRGIIQGAGSSDIVLIAGRGHETRQIIGDREIELDDRSEARQALELRSNARDGEVI